MVHKARKANLDGLKKNEHPSFLLLTMGNLHAKHHTCKGSQTPCTPFVQSLLSCLICQHLLSNEIIFNQISVFLVREKTWVNLLTGDMPQDEIQIILFQDRCNAWKDEKRRRKIGELHINATMKTCLHTSVLVQNCVTSKGLQYYLKDYKDTNLSGNI